MNTLREFETKIFNRVNPAIHFSVTRYVMAVGFFVAIVVFGIIAAYNLGVDQLPTINIPVVVVNTTFTGATPSVVDEQITKIIENTVSGLSGITDINSTSQTGSSRVVISFEQSINKDLAANQVSALISAATKSLPTGVDMPTVKTFDPNSQAVVQFGLSGNGISLSEINDYVQTDLVPQLERVEGVANIQIDGGPNRRFQVLLNPNRLRSYNLRPQDVSAAIKNSAINQSIGSIVNTNSVLAFSTQSIPTDPQTISSILVNPIQGVSVGDVASVRDMSIADNYARVNGKPVVLVSVQRTSDSNTVAVVQNVQKLLEKTRLPEGYNLFVSYDATGAIKASVQSTYHELVITSLVVAVIILLFLGKLNTAFTVILAIPIALSAAPVVYRLFGFTFNLVSLLALISAIGIVVDDSIVVAENVERYRVMGFGLKESVLKGASEVFSAVVAASLSLLSVLIPVSFIGGFVGRYIQQFALGLAAAVAFSLLEALLFLTVRMAYTPEAKVYDWKDLGKSLGTLPDSVSWGLRAWKRTWGIVFALAVAGLLVYLQAYRLLPILCLYPLALGIAYYLLRVFLIFLQALTMTLHHWTESFIGWVRDGYARMLPGIIRQSVWVLLGVGAFLAVTFVFVMPRVPFNFVPQADNSLMNVNLRLPPGTPIAVTNEATGKLEAFLFSRPEVDIVQTVVASSSTFSGANQPQNSTINVTLKSVTERQNVFVLMPAFRREMLALLRDQPSVRIMINAPGSGPGASSHVNLNILSANLDLLKNQDALIIQTLQNNQWASDVASSMSDTSFENDFLPEASSLRGTGITPSDIGQALRIAAAGVDAATVQIGGESYPIRVMVDPVYLADGQSLLNLPIYSSALKTNLQVGQLGKFELNQAPVSVSRYNRLYTSQYTINTKLGAPPILAYQNELTNELVEAGALKGGLEVSSGSRTGMAALASQLATQGPAAFLLALFLAYLVMGAQFNSWRYPIYLLLPVPLALVGALWTVVLKGSSLDVFSVLGMLMLIGLSAKNAILYLDFVVERIGKMPLNDALVDAGRLRFRPIVMTTLTVLVTSFPLIFGTGQGSEFGKGLGTVMFGGILSSAVLTFFVVPAAFYLFERKRVALIEAETLAEGADLGGVETSGSQLQASHEQR